MNYAERGCEDLTWIQKACYRVQWWTFVRKSGSIQGSKIHY